MTEGLLSATDFRASLLDAGVLVATGVDGLYHRSGAFERIVRGIERLASAAGSDQNAPMLYFPPMMPRADFELTDYLRSFPNLIGSIDIFVGDDRDHATLLKIAEAEGDWTQALTPADVVLGPAACHSLYRGLAGRRREGGERVECQGFIFRHEPSLDPARMQAFRMHEFVYVGESERAVEHRDLWLRRGLDLMRNLGLDVEAVVANDPFFGRAGRILATNQLETALKYEIVAPITADHPTAICSANYHQDHFGVPFGIETANGGVAHSSCFGFGLERITLALLSRYGLDLDSWPEGVCSQLWR